MSLFGVRMFTRTAPCVENAVLCSLDGRGVLVKRQRPSMEKNSPLIPPGPCLSSGQDHRVLITVHLGAGTCGSSDIGDLSQDCAV